MEHAIYPASWSAQTDRLGAVGIGVADLERSSAFYADVLGLEVLRTYELGYLNEFVLGYQDSNKATAVLMNWPNEKRSYDGNNVKLVFYVDDPAGVIARIRARGGKIEREAGPIDALPGAIVGLGRDPVNYVLQDVDRYNLRHKGRPAIVGPMRKKTELHRIALPKLIVVLCLISFLLPLRAMGADLALASVSAVAVDVTDSQVLLEQNADIVLPIASITKLMTALVVLESGTDLDEWLTIEEWDRKTAKNAYSRIRLTSSARRRDLLRIALMSSENRAAYNLALHHPGGFESFVNDMNAKARSLNMRDTHFTDPTGLDVTNRSSAADLARMVIAAYQQSLLREYSTTRQFTVNFKQPRYRLSYGNTNPLTGSDRWEVGLTKTGYLTEAGRCLVMVTEMAGRKVGVVLLNSLGTRSPLGDAGRIRRYLESGTRSNVAKAALDHRAQVMQTLGLSVQ